MAEPMQASTPRLKALQNLASQLPVSNSKVAAGQQAARDMQLQSAVKAAPVSAPIAQTAQTTGAAAAGQAGQQAIERATQQIQQGGQVGQVGLQEQARAGQARVAGLKSGAREAEMGNVQKLAQISEEAKKELFDRQTSFEKDEMGRTHFNERQLADYAKVNAQSDESYKNYAQQSEQLSRRKLQAMEHAARVVESDLEQKYQQAKQKGDQQSALEIEKTRKDMADKIQREKTRAANRAAAWQAGGTIVGAGAGALIGGPAGAAAGASLGSAAGGMAASQTSA